jgi:hypothetical protein
MLSGYSEMKKFTQNGLERKCVKKRAVRSGFMGG